MCVQWRPAGTSRDGKGAGTMLAYVLSGGGSLGALQAGAGGGLLGRESLFSNDRLRDYLARSLPLGLRTFGEVYERTGVRALTVAVGLHSGRGRVFGEARGDRLIDGG